ncbi:MAG: prepilin-type N-terminal cleavage/methylation domain-containing protein [Rubrivivax sp.]
MKAFHTRQRGVSLIEAVVAMAVMAFGMVGMVGLQAVLRGNASIAAQRSEAVRIARTLLEEQRAFSVITVASGRTAYDSIATQGATAVVVLPYAFTLQQIVTPGAGTDMPDYKTLTVDVSWNDIAGQQQSIRFPSLLTAVSSEMAGSMATSMDFSVVQQLGGRNPVIPLAAVDQGNGTSRFYPSGAPTPPAPNPPYWLFNNLTGLILSVCTGAGSCDTPADGFALLTGYVRFATVNPPSPAPNLVDPPVAGLGLTPPGNLISGLGVTVTPVAPDPPIACAVADDPSGGFMRYFCAVELRGLTPPRAWSGRSTVTGLSGNLSATVADPTAALLRVCRYTSVQANPPVPLPTPAPPLLPTADHPLDYVAVTKSLGDQNFLVIKGGDGSVAYACPDGPATAPTLGRTWHHQPAY